MLYRELRPSIGICLLDAIEFRSAAELHHHFQLRTDSGLLLTDCLQVHLFELPRYVPPSDNREISDPIDQWLYFFRQAGQSTAKELTARLPDPVFAEATGVLEMIGKNPGEGRFYNERLKIERDARARYLQAREDGWQEGLQKGRQEALEEDRREGELLGGIKLLQSLLGDTPATSEELLELGIDRLRVLERELRERLRERMG